MVQFDRLKPRLKFCLCTGPIYKLLHTKFQLLIHCAGYKEVTQNLNVQLKSVCLDSTARGDMIFSCADWIVKEGVQASEELVAL